MHIYYQVKRPQLWGPDYMEQQETTPTKHQSFTAVCPYWVTFIPSGEEMDDIFTLNGHSSKDINVEREYLIETSSEGMERNIRVL